MTDPYHGSMLPTTPYGRKSEGENRTLISSLQEKRHTIRPPQNKHEGGIEPRPPDHYERPVLPTKLSVHHNKYNSKTH